jgi:hypothetical protein
LLFVWLLSVVAEIQVLVGLGPCLIFHSSLSLSKL